MRTLYFDYNATTPLAAEARAAMAPFLDEHFGAPSSRHALGQAAQEALEDARVRLARLLGVQRDEIVFTSGGTESNNLALKGVAARYAPAASGHLVLSSIEHPSVLEPARYLESLGYGLTLVGCNSQGVVDPRGVAAALRPDTVLVSVQHANHELGTIQPLRQLADLCHAAGVLLHTDAAQTVGKIPVRPRELGVDLLSLAGHKMYGPKGVGALYVRRGVDLEPLLHGAGHESGLRAGTENVAGLVALGAAATWLEGHLETTAPRLARQRDRLQQRLQEGIGPGLVVHAQKAERLPNTLAVTFPEVQASELLRRTAQLCASTGSPRHGGASAISPILAAIGLTPATAQGTVRLSLGWPTTDDEVELAASLLLEAWESLRSR